jgi:hypothetical protein
MQGSNNIFVSALNFWKVGPLKHHRVLTLSADFALQPVFPLTFTMQMQSPHRIATSWAPDAEV